MNGIKNVVRNISYKKHFLAKLNNNPHALPFNVEVKNKKSCSFFSYFSYDIALAPAFIRKLRTLSIVLIAPKVFGRRLSPIQ